MIGYLLALSITHRTPAPLTIEAFLAGFHRLQGHEVTLVVPEGRLVRRRPQLTYVANDFLVDGSGHRLAITGAPILARALSRRHPRRYVLRVEGFVPRWRRIPALDLPRYQIVIKSVQVLKRWRKR